MARKKKPALSSGGSGPDLEPDPLEVIPDPYILPEPEKEPEPVMAVKVVEPPKPKKPKPNRVGVKLEVFLRVSGKRMDQMAGFRRYALNHGMRQMEIKDWHKEYEKFLRLPV